MLGAGTHTAVEQRGVLLEPAEYALRCMEVGASKRFFMAVTIMQRVVARAMRWRWHASRGRDVSRGRDAGQCWNVGVCHVCGE